MLLDVAATWTSQSSMPGFTLSRYRAYVKGQPLAPNDDQYQVVFVFGSPMKLTVQSIIEGAEVLPLTLSRLGDNSWPPLSHRFRITKSSIREFSHILHLEYVPPAETTWIRKPVQPSPRHIVLQSDKGPIDHVHHLSHAPQHLLPNVRNDSIPRGNEYISPSAWS